MNKVNHFLIFCTLLFGAVQFANAQSKPGCDPKSCSPDNTKVEEAKVITDLRTRLQTSFSKLQATKLPFSNQSISYNVPKGASDDESVMFLLQASNTLKSEIIRVVPKEKILSELINAQMAVPASKQQLVGNLKMDIALLDKQINALVR